MYAFSDKKHGCASPGFMKSIHIKLVKTYIIYTSIKADVTTLGYNLFYPITALIDILSSTRRLTFLSLLRFRGCPRLHWFGYINEKSHIENARDKINILNTRCNK